MGPVDDGAKGSCRTSTDHKKIPNVRRRIGDGWHRASCRACRQKLNPGLLDKTLSPRYLSRVNAIRSSLILLALSWSLGRAWEPPPNESLPSTDGLPDLFRFANGDAVVSPDDWNRRREELKAMLLYYQYGRMPGRPDAVTATVDREVTRTDGLGREEWLTLSIGSDTPLTMRLVLYLPKQAGPRPVIIREEGTLGRTKQVPLFLAKGYAFVEYARHDLDPDKKATVGPAQAAYPEFDWATLAVWAWGGMRVVDYLETRDEIDKERIAITGHSRGGKMALLAGALDERIALVVPNGSGAGGAGSSRLLGPGAESLGMNDKPHWYHERIQWFAGKEDRLPIDQHMLKALVAPRALLCTESSDDLFANPYGTQETSRAARAAWEMLGAPVERNGIAFRTGEHASNDDDWATLLAFAEWHFFGRAPDDPSAFWAFPDPEIDYRWRDSGPVRYVTIHGLDNPPDADHFGTGARGQVKHLYRICYRKVGQGEYTIFLNAVAQSDPHGLYHDAMDIIRSGTDGAYTYDVSGRVAHHPVRHVSWFDALRYCNWLHHGKPKGPSSPHTTEAGPYDLSRAPEEIARAADAKFFLPTIDEWYKAAYYDPEKRSYHLFPLPDQQGIDGTWFHANRSAYFMEHTEDHVWEWMESAIGKPFRGLRSDSWFQGNNRQAAGHFYSNPDLKRSNIGFRVARAPK